MTEQWFGIGCHLLSANILNFAEEPETQQRDTREIGPSIVFYGARLWESQAAMVQARILGADAIKRFAFRLLMPIGYKMADLKYTKARSQACSGKYSILWLISPYLDPSETALVCQMPESAIPPGLCSARMPSGSTML